MQLPILGWEIIKQAQAADITPPFTPSFGNLGELVGNKIFPAAVQVGAIFAFFYAVWGGLNYIMSEGDPKKTEAAKNMITSAVIGFVILFSAYAVMKIIDAVLGSNFTG
ncbi:MAG: pilin [bacterium]|nr:pilin [bacterium]